MAVLLIRVFLSLFLFTFTIKFLNLIIFYLDFLYWYIKQWKMLNYRKMSPLTQKDKQNTLQKFYWEDSRNICSHANEIMSKVEKASVFLMFSSSWYLVPFFWLESIMILFDGLSSFFSTFTFFFTKSILHFKGMIDFYHRRVPCHCSDVKKLFFSYLTAIQKSILLWLVKVGVEIVVICLIRTGTFRGWNN